jgi:transposase
MMVKRAAAISLIKEGKKYREIGKILWISPSAISSIKKSIRENLGYQARKNLGKPTPKGRIQKKDIKKRSGFPWPSITGKGGWRFLYYQR